MKQSCKNCYAAETGGHPLCGESKGCTLGYKTYNGKPMEECPKPKTWKELERVRNAIARIKKESPAPASKQD